MNEWQPIETAPRDRTLILCWATCVEGPPDYCLSSYRPSLGFNRYDIDENLWSPTHWMPLPKPPSEQSEGSQ
jgi:hypothetical protein